MTIITFHDIIVSVFKGTTFSTWALIMFLFFAIEWKGFNKFENVVSIYFIGGKTNGRDYPS